DGLVSFLEAYGNQIKKIYFTHSTKSDKLLSALSVRYCQLPICIQALQIGCPKLQTLMNVTPVPTMTRNTPSSKSGFPMLEELCIATSSHSFMTDNDLNNVLHGSPHLRVLDLRGGSRITATGHSHWPLPCERLECLYWGLYFNINTMVASKKGIHMLAHKWSSTLREIDLASQPFSEEDMGIAMGHLAHGGGVNLFCSLNPSGINITSSALRKCMYFLNFQHSSCWYLPRGLKRVYHGQEDIQLLLDKLD
uniref:F-box and leucine-rich repeat protein 6 n=1 Tax=Sinocyclocheilus anshuiensis TaxID=1608454 RepID=A0A671N1Z1_9TELE